MRSRNLVAALATMAFVGFAAAQQPQYQIYDMGVLSGDTASQGFRVSTGGIGVGRSLHSNGSTAIEWTQGGGTVGLQGFSGRAYAVANGANDSGIIVGTGATTSFGSGRLPLIWTNGVVAQLALPNGQTLGDANDVNASGMAVGSCNSGTLQRGVIYSAGSSSIITTTTNTGCYFLTAFGVNDSGLVVGQGIDPNNAARNVGIVYDSVSNTAYEVGSLSGMNGALAFDVSNSGFVVGSAMLNQGSGTPFIWSQSNGMSAIPLAAGSSQGGARGVNSAGWVVGTDSGQFAVPFVYDGTSTYRIQDVIAVGGAGWDLATNTSSSALGISDNGVIVGTGVFNGAVHGYALVPVPEPATLAILGLGALAAMRKKRAV